MTKRIVLRRKLTPTLVKAAETPQKAAPGPLKLYVWEGVLTDYTSGIAFALAGSVDEAREAICAEWAIDMSINTPPSQDTLIRARNTLAEIYNEEPDVYDTTTGFYQYGGG